MLYTLRVFGTMNTLALLARRTSGRAIKVGLVWEQPLQPTGTNSSVITTNNVVRKTSYQRNPEAGNHILLTFSWRWDHGLKSKAQDVELDN